MAAADSPTTSPNPVQPARTRRSRAARVGAMFLQRYPNSRLDIRLVDSMVDPIKDGFDVVFGTGPLQDSTLIARKVFDYYLLGEGGPEAAPVVQERAGDDESD